ncbi:Hypothetical predicted protein [Cloeon dipterum]|uniref:Uncharacterized protein n=1 Tax=Cloeon dipterum TaxID=197152 RepID=A0A8S1DWX8_9INSE|nr:Hypothetical predicted protein [Cloeon dipterum]CAB3385209.1 Hypothetical predicted protein [Cloeon dipterum]
MIVLLLDALADIAGFYPALDISLQFAPPEICSNAIGSLLHTKVATDKRVVTELENNFPHVVRSHWSLKRWAILDLEDLLNTFGKARLLRKDAFSTEICDDFLNEAIGV